MGERKRTKLIIVRGVLVFKGGYDTCTKKKERTKLIIGRVYLYSKVDIILVRKKKNKEIKNKVNY